jgi:uncharacterized protein (TIGR02466 family)
MTPFEIIPLFPQALYRSKFRSITTEEKEIIEQCPIVKQPLGNSISNGSHFLDDVKLSGLKADLIKHISIYAREIMKFDNELYITNSWKNVTVMDEQHIMHNHSNSIISGVLYLNVSNSQPSISFNRMNSPYLLNYLPSEFNLFNSIEWNVPVDDNDIIIFPSSCYHYVKPNTSNATRLTIAFNTFARGRFGTQSSGADLILN